jgi:hypothetical protein
MTEKNSTALIGAIERLAEILNGPDKWTQGAASRDAEGHSVRWSDPSAIRFCLTGACAKAASKENGYVENAVFVPLLDRIESMLKESITAWNDKEGRTFNEVRAVIERLRSAAASANYRGN